MSDIRKVGNLPIASAVSYLIGVNASQKASRIPQGSFVSVHLVQTGGDLDDFVATAGSASMFILKGTQSHAPENGNPNGALLLVFSHADSHCTQFFIPLFSQGAIFSRVMLSGEWRSWYRYSGTAVNTMP